MRWSAVLLCAVRSLAAMQERTSSRQSLLLVAPSMLVWPALQGVQGSSEPPGENVPGEHKTQSPLLLEPHPGAHTLH